jgi:D-methionine transport system substrate-binding protein
MPRTLKHSFRAAVSALAGALFTISAFAAEPLKIGTTGGPIAEVLEVAVKRAKEEGQDVKIVEFSDWITINEALASGEIDVNLFQHQPFLNAAIEARGYDFVPVAPAYVLPVGLYSQKIKGFTEVKNGDTVAIASDPVNGARGLQLFEKAGLIKLKPGTAEKATLRDIAENPKNLKFLEIEAPQLPRILPDVALAQVSISYLISSGGDPESLLIADGFGDPRYALQFVARKDRKDDPRIAAFIKSYRSDELKKFISDKYGRFFIPVW